MKSKQSKVHDFTSDGGAVLNGEIVDLGNYRQAKSVSRAEKLILQPGNFREKVQCFRDLIKADPKDPANYFHLSQIHIQEEQFESAIQVLKRAHRQCGASVSLFVRLVEGYEYLGHDKKLYSALRRFCASFPEEYIAHFKLAEFYFYKEKFNKSIRCLLKVLKLGIKNEDVFFLLAQGFRQVGRYKRAIFYYRKARQHGVEDPIYEFSIGLCLKELGHYDQALGNFFRGLKVPGVNPVYFYFQIGLSYFLKDNFPKAINSFHRVLSYAPSDESAIYFIGLCRNNLEQHEEALEVFNKLRKINPFYFNVYNNIGNTHYFLKNYEEAIKAFEQSLTLDPDFERVHNNIGNLYCEQGNFHKGLKHLKKAFELNPEYLMPIVNIAAAYKAMEDYPSAQKYYQLLIDRGEKSACDYFNLAYIQYLQKLIPEAESSIEMALAVDRNHNDALQLQAAIYFSKERFDECLKIYKGIFEYSPENRDLEFNMAMVYVRQNDFQKAADHLENLHNSNAIGEDKAVYTSETAPDPTAAIKVKQEIEKYLGLSYYYLERFEDSYKFLLRHSTQSPDDDSYIEILCELALSMNDLAQAQISYTRWRKKEKAPLRQVSYYTRLQWRRLKEGSLF